MKNVEFKSLERLSLRQTEMMHTIAAKNFCTIEPVSAQTFALTGTIMSLVAFANETGFNQIRLICKTVN